MAYNRTGGESIPQREIAIGGAFSVVGVLLALHPQILTQLGFAGGFQFLLQASPVYVGVGAGILVLSITGHRITSRSSLVVLVVTLCVTAVWTTPLRSSVVTLVERYLLYIPAMTAFPSGVVAAKQQTRFLASLVGGTTLTVLLAVVLIVNRSPRGPIGVFLIWSLVVVLISSIPLLCVGWYLGSQSQ